jgi:hypothetical protein
MKLEQREWERNGTFLSAFDSLIGDERTRRIVAEKRWHIYVCKLTRSCDCAFFPRNGGRCQRGT